MTEAKDERRRVPVGTRLEGRWQVSKILGEDAFGAVYEVNDAERPGMVFVLKVESNADDPEGPPKMLPLEVTVLRALRNIGANITRAMNRAVRTINSIMCAQRPETGQHVHQPGAQRFTFHLHSELRSMLPNVNSATGRPHRPRVRVGFRSAPRYASANALNDIDQGRIDDMWSWFFSIIELTVSLLPWDSDQNSPNEINALMRWLGKKKLECIQDMNLTCQGCPKEVGSIYQALVKMQFIDKPDYDLFINFRKKY